MLREIIGREIRNFTRKAADLIHGRQVVQGDQIEEFWALRDVSFQVKQGEVLGIIGRNGAGKNTLLEISAVSLNPPAAAPPRRGRVSLLEVDAGFHPELSGRENIFLNGAILGMAEQRSSEVRRDRHLLRGREIPRYASQALFVRHVRAPRLRGGGHLEPEILDGR